MFEITADNAADYLRATGHVAAADFLEVHELVGGVSNVVLLVTFRKNGEPFVLKQARGRLRVKEEWLCPVERIWREVDVLRICGDLLPVQEAKSAGHTEHLVARVPAVLWEDRENFVYAMTAAPAGHCTWKELLLAGPTRHCKNVVITAGKLLARLHATSWENAQIATRLEDRHYFEQLRLDPYYRQIARVHADLSSSIQRLIDSVWSHRHCLVHGDFSPKNLLVYPGRLMLIDFEVGHFGDPAFDLGFFLTHLVLKSIWAGERQQEYLELATQFWSTYQVTFANVVGGDHLPSIEQRMLLNVAGCLLARVDGKSPVEYLNEPQRQRVRQLARDWILDPPASLASALAASRKPRH